MLKDIPNGLDEIIATYGDFSQPDWEGKNIISFDLPYALIYDGMRVDRTRCHRLVRDNFVSAFMEIEAAHLTSLATNFGGIYNKRAIRGMPAHPSTHSWGIAIDLEPARYPLGSHDRFPDAIVSIFKNNGFFYGGDFVSRKDGMHYQLAGQY